MKYFFLMVCLIGMAITQLSAQVAINEDNSEADPSAMLDVKSTDKGMLIPRMLTSERDAISNPAEGLMIYNLDEKGIEFWNGTIWYNPSNPPVPVVPLPPFETLIGGTGYDQASSVAQASDGSIIVVGRSESSNNGDVSGLNNGTYDFWIVKLDESGNILWNYLYGGSAWDTPSYVAITDDGGCIVAGNSSSSASGDVTGTSHGSSDCWLVKLDASGSIMWQKLYGGSLADNANCVQQTTDGGYIVAAVSASSASGDVTGTNHGSEDYWIFKLDASGNISWQNLYGGASWETAQTIVQTADGGYIIGGRSTSSSSGMVTGTNYGGNDYWIVKIDATGNIVWEQLYGGSDSDWPYDIIQSSDGNYWVAGISSSSDGVISGTNNGGIDYWILQLGVTGNIVSENLYGGSGSDYGRGIHETPEGDFVLSGYSSSSSSGGGDVNGTNHGSFDFWTLKINEAGTILWEILHGGSLEENAYKCVPSIDGGFFIPGGSRSSANGDVTGTNHSSKDYWIVKLDKDGGIIW